MTLHDRIMALADYGSVSSPKEKIHFVDRSAAAQLAAEADELMALLAEDLRDQCTNPNDYTDNLLAKYNAYKDQSNEQ